MKFVGEILKILEIEINIGNIGNGRVFLKYPICSFTCLHRFLDKAKEERLLGEHYPFMELDMKDAF